MSEKRKRLVDEMKKRGVRIEVVGLEERVRKAITVLQEPASDADRESLNETIDEALNILLGIQPK